MKHPLKFASSLKLKLMLASMSIRFVLRLKVEPNIVHSFGHFLYMEEHRFKEEYNFVLQVCTYVHFS